MEVEDMKKEIGKVIEEIQEFTEYSPKGEAHSIEYLYAARNLANCYDDIITSEQSEEALKKINLLRDYLKDYPQYFDFHEE